MIEFKGFVVPGDPIAKGRPRAVAAGKHARMYTPKRTENFENRIAMFAQNAGIEIIEAKVPVEVQVNAIFKRPKDLHRKKDPEGCILLPWRADVDNILKAVLDGLNGIAFDDDKQVARVKITKWLSEKSGVGRTEIGIRRMISPEGGESAQARYLPPSSLPFDIPVARKPRL